MFFQQEQIEKNLQCKICHEILRAPKLLPCGEAVCEECILNFIRIQVIPNQEFKCPVCKDIHDIPRNRKFPSIKSIESILQQRPNQIVPCKLVKKFHQDLDENQNMLMDLKEFVHGGTDKVQKYCQELRGDVHLATQIRIVEIHEQGDKLIQQIDEFQENRIKEMEGEMSKTNSLIGHMEKFNSIWRSNLKKFNKEESEIEDALGRLLSIHKQADLELNDLNNLVLKYKKCKFNRNEKKLAKNFIGSLDMEDEDVDEEDEESEDEDSGISKCSLDYSGIQDWSDIWIDQIMEISDVHDIELIKEKLLENENDVEATIFELLERKRED